MKLAISNCIPVYNLVTVHILCLEPLVLIFCLKFHRSYASRPTVFDNSGVNCWIAPSDRIVTVANKMRA